MALFKKIMFFRLAKQLLMARGYCTGLYMLFYIKGFLTAIIRASHIA